MTKNNFNGILCSRNCNDFILLSDGLGSYLLYYDSDLILEIAESKNPKKIYKYEKLANPIHKIKENYKNNQLVLSLIEEITKIIGDAPANQRKIQSILMDLLRTLKDAETDNQYNREFFNKAPSEIKQKAMEISKNRGYDAPLFDNEIAPGNIEKFNNLLISYNYNWYDLFKTELYDYVNNEENIFKGVIYCLSALYGYGSRLIIVNGGAEVGKSEYINTIKKLMPTFENLGSSTPASIRRKDHDYFNKKIVYLGDKGLKGTDDEEFKGLLEVFGGLITDKEFKRDLVQGDKVLEFNLKSDGVCVFYTEPYTNLKIFGAGEQYTTRSDFITVNPVKDGLNVFLQDRSKENPFYEVHKDYIRYIIDNPLDIKLSNDVRTKIYQSSRESLRTAYHLENLFKAYCQYMQVGNPLGSDVIKFLDVFKPKYEITEIEYKVYEKLYNGLNVLSKDDLEYKVYDDGGINTDDLLKTRTNRKSKSFFTAKQIKTYFKNDFKMNKNLKDTIDQIPMIIKNLYMAGLINIIEWQYNNQNVYYVPYNRDMEK